MPDTLFISYKSEENPFALQLAAALKNRGIHVWIDRMDIKPADNWIEAISAALQTCNGMIAILTPDYFRSPVCLDELNSAYTNKRLIIPLLLRPNIEERDTDLKNKVPFWLSHRQRLDFTDWLDDKAFQAKIDQLVERIERDQRSSVGDLPSPEIQYLTSLIADLESQQGVENYIALSAQSEVVRVDPRPRKNIDPSLALLLKSPTPERDLHPETKPIKNIQEAVADHAKFVLIGDPGAGKTTTLRHLALEMARARLDYLTAPDSGEKPLATLERGRGEVLLPLPFIAYLPRWSSEPTAADFIRRQWASTNIGGDVVRELQSGHVRLFLDGLNEMGGEGKNKAALLRDWLQSPDGPHHVIITCRQADYRDDLDLKLPTVLVEPLTAEKIQEFAVQYLGAEQAETFLKKVFPQYKNNDSDWVRTNKEVRSLFYLARNPYLLAALTLIFEYGGDLPRNTGDLFEKLVIVSWERERLRLTRGWISFDDMQAAFGNLAFSMIDEGQPIDVPLNYAETKLGNADLLHVASRANFITTDDNKLRFSHQLLLEYFAAVGIWQAGLVDKLNEEPFVYFGLFERGFDSKWDEVVVALSGIMPDPTSLVNELVPLELFLAAACLASGIEVAASVRQQVIAGLLENLRNPYSTTSGKAAAALGSIGDQSTVPALLETLRDPVSTVRDKAVWVLGSVGDQSTVPALLDALHDSDAKVASKAAEALGSIGDPLAVSSLLEALRGSVDIVALHAAGALRKIGIPAIPALLEALHDSNTVVRFRAAAALGQIGDSSALPGLIEALSDVEAKVRYRVVKAFGNLGDPAAIPHLSLALRDSEESVVYHAAEALEKIGTPEALEAVRRWREEQNKSDG